MLTSICMMINNGNILIYGYPPTIVCCSCVYPDPVMRAWRRYGHAHAHRHAAEYHAAAAHHNMAASYGGLLLGRGGLHAHAHAHAQYAHDPAACAPYSYPAPHGQSLTLYFRYILHFVLCVLLFAVGALSSFFIVFSSIDI